MTTRLRHILINGSLLLGTVILFFGGIEIVLRITGIEKGRPVPPPLFQKNDDPEIGYELKPNMTEHAYRSTITTDSDGLRSSPADATKKTIALLGDSIAFGYGLEDSEVLAEQIGETLEHTFTVRNVAAPGYNLRQELALYRTKHLSPSALILVFHFNDLRDQEPAELSADGNIRPKGSAVEVHSCRPIDTGILGLVPGRCWLDLHSAFYRVVKKLVSARQESQNLTVQEAMYRATAFTESVTPEELDQYVKTLDRLVQELPPSLPKLFVIWPEKELHFTARPQLIRMVEQRGFRVLDLYQVFGNDAETLTWDTVHPSAKTVEQAAGVLVAALREWKMLPD